MINKENGAGLSPAPPLSIERIYITIMDGPFAGRIIEFFDTPPRYVTIVSETDVPWVYEVRGKEAFHDN